MKIRILTVLPICFSNFYVDGSSSLCLLFPLNTAKQCATVSMDLPVIGKTKSGGKGFGFEFTVQDLW